MRYEVDARIVAPGRSEVTCKASRIAFDSSPGQGPELPGPAELLAGAFAACLLKNVERFAGILPFRHAGASVHVTTEREDHPPRFARIHYELRVVTDEAPGAGRSAAPQPAQARDRLQHPRGRVRGHRRPDRRAGAQPKRPVM